MTDTRKLNAYITMSGLSRLEVANHIGLSLNSLWKKINNKVEFKASEIYKLCSLLKITDKDSIFFAENVDFKST